MMSSFPPLAAIECPYCPRCHTRMKLVRILPVPDREESRTFECAKCNFTETVKVPDPLKSDSAGWVVGELRPPK
jgi:transposase-like protein